MPYGCTLQVGDSTDAIACILQDLDHDRARVRVLARTRPLPAVAVGSLWLTDPESRLAVALPVVTGWGPEEDEPNVYELFLPGPDQRRLAVRVRPPVGSVEVWLATRRAPMLQVEIVDVSTGGMCVEAPSDRFPQARTACTFQVLLPGDSWPLVLAGEVRHRLLVDGCRVRIGVAFDRARTTDADLQFGHLDRWIEARRAHLLQRTRRTRSSPWDSHEAL